MIARRRFQERLDHYQKNVAKVVKIQSFYRAKMAGDAYRKLSNFYFYFFNWASNTM